MILYAAEVEDITEPPRPNKYERLKSELIRSLSASRVNKILQLTTSTREKLGDRKPSRLLHHMQHFIGPDVLTTAQQIPQMPAAPAGSTELGNQVPGLTRQVHKLSVNF